MATNDKDQQKEEVGQHKRMAAGAWIDGEQIRERGAATMPEANSDHGSFNRKGVDKKNA